MDNRAQSSGITLDELLAEVDKLQQNVAPVILDSEQIEFIRYCREKKMTWEQTSLLWSKKWSHLSPETIRRRYYRVITQ